MELRLDRLTKQFGSAIAVDRLSATLTPGVYGLLGANGAGKTTLMRMICDVLKPTSGSVVWNGAPIERLGERYRSVLGYLPQDFGYYPDFSALDFMLYLSALKGLDSKAAKRRSMELLDLVGLKNVAKRKVKTFSGGMKQRLGIAQAVINDPQVLVLDEPTAGLDPQQRIAVRNLIAEIALHRIVLLSTHVVQDVEYAAKELILLSDGAVLRQASAQTLLREMQGQVWEVPARGEAEIAHLRTLGQFCGIVPSGEGLFVRLLAPAQPTPDSRPARPELEDVYLACFGEEGRL